MRIKTLVYICLARVAIGLAIALTASCIQTTAPEGPGEGTWVGTTIDRSVTLTITLSRSDTLVTGFGIMSGGTTTIALDITGTVVATKVELTIESEGYPPAIFTSAAALPNSMVGRLNGSGFDDVYIMLRRE